jgi:hypothetical protein
MERPRRPVSSPARRQPPPPPRPLPPKAILGLLVGATLGLVACEPGRLRCEDPPYCDEFGPLAFVLDAGEGRTARPAPPAGPDAAPPAPAPPDAASPNAGALTAATALPGCAKYPTVGQLETGLLAKSCGLCHTKTELLGPTDMASPEMWRRFVDAPVRGENCKGAKIVDRAKTADSFLLLKLGRDRRCPDGSTDRGGIMPPAPPALGAEDLACMRTYVEVIAR